MFQFILILGLVTLLMDWYAFQGLKRLTADWRSARARKTAYAIYWIFFIGFIIGFGISIYIRFADDRSNPISQWFINALSRSPFWMNPVPQFSTPSRASFSPSFSITTCSSSSNWYPMVA